MKKHYHLYLGKAGHLAVMSEFLIRGWNVAIPEVDIGDDIFVVQDDMGTLNRVQVKTSTSNTRHGSFSGRFNLPLLQLRRVSPILVHYVFIVRHKGRWTEPVIIRQDYLLNFVQNGNFGTIHKENLNLYFSFSQAGIECSGIDLSSFVSDYTDFPVVEE